MKIRQKNKGITLVALVITIIILLILAGIIISSLTVSRLFRKAELAKEETEKAKDNEYLEISKYEDIMNGYINASRDTISVNKDSYDALVKKVSLLEDNYKELLGNSTINNNNYSTEEQIIGTWINGKPLYRKIISGISFKPLSFQWTNSTVKIENIEQVTKCGLSQGASFIYSFLSATNNGVIKCWNLTNTDYNYSSMLVEYTKTTDTFTSMQNND